MPTLREPLIWLRPVHHWTLIAAIVVVAFALVMAIGVVLDLMSVRRSPGAVFNDVYITAQAQKYQAAKDFLSRDAKAEVASFTMLEWHALLDGFTNEMTLRKVTVAGVRNFGSQAVVGGFLDFSDGRSKTLVDLMVKEGRHWRIEWPIGERGFQTTVDRLD